MPKRPTFRLTTEIIAASVGSGVTCLALAGIGRTYPLYARRPGPELNTRVAMSRRARLDLPSGAAHVIKPEPAKPPLIRVEVMGPIEQRAGYHDPCAGWSDGHDAICERLCAAFEEGDVLLVIDSPGGAAAGIQQAVERVQKAKAAAGRHVTVFANEMIGSAACWWACAIGDEIYVPPSGQIGSIGSRGEHTSITAALAQAGVEKTYFTWPDDGKVAFAPERPLSEEGRARGSRDANIAGEMFCAAVVAARGISRDDVMAMHADMFTGEDAVKRGLADGVASEDDVIAYALKRAEGGDESATSTRSARVRARGDRAMTRTEDEEERARSEQEDMPPPSSKPMPGKEPDGKCGDCGSQNEENAKFCDQCGASLAARPMEAGKSEERQQPPAPDRMSASSLNAILGVADGASLPVVKMAALDLRSVFDHAAKLTDENPTKTTAARVRGKLTALSRDAADGARAARELRALQEKSDAKERLQLAHRFVKLGDPRERVYRLDAEGKVIGLKGYFANAPLEELRGEVEAREKAQPPASPFREDRERAEVAAKEAGATGATMTLEAAKKNPRVVVLYNEAKARGSKQTLDDVANEWLKAAAGGA